MFILWPCKRPGQNLNSSGIFILFFTPQKERRIEKILNLENMDGPGCLDYLPKSFKSAGVIVYLS